MLAAAGVTLGADDTVNPAVATPVTDGLQIAVTRIAYVTDDREPADRPAGRPDRQNDSSLAVGITTVVQQGQPGSPRSPTARR